MKLMIKFKPLQIILLVLIIAICAAAVVVNSLIMAEVKPFFSSNLPLSIVSTCCSSLVLLIALLVCVCSRYEFGEEKLTIRFACLPERVNYKDVTVLRYNSDSNQLFLVYKSEKSRREDGLESFMFLTYPSNFDKIQAFLKDKGILYQIFNDKEE